MNQELLKEWPVIDTLEFETVTVDVTKWEDDTYTALFNFYVATSVPPHSGLTLCTQLGGKSLKEVYDKLATMLDTGMFDGINVGAHGTVWDAEGTEIGSVNWLEYSEQSEFDAECSVDAFKIGGTTTLQ